MEEDLDKKIRRLSKMVDADDGFYVLSLHSFIEYYLRFIKGYGIELNFPELTWMFREELLENNEDTFIEGLSSLGQLGRQHSLTNRVRHSFEEMGEEEARAATHLFIRFCSLAEIRCSVSMDFFKARLDEWKNRGKPGRQDIVIKNLQDKLSELKSKNSFLSGQLEDYRQLQYRISELEFQISWKNIEIEKSNIKVRSKDEKLDQLRRERFALMQEKNKYSDLEKYLEYMGRLTVYTRSRHDYERSISELTPEQKEAAGSIKLNSDCLIRGSAGTGKSLVLIDCLRQSLLQKDLAFLDDNKILLLTFTRNLLKYNRYVSIVMGMKIPDSVFSTVDTFVLEKLRGQNPDINYDFSLADNYFCGNMVPDFMTPDELKAEIDDFLFGNFISRKEYVEENIRREGMSSRLNTEKRREIWNIREKFAAHMDEKCLYTINYGRFRLCSYLHSLPDNEKKVLRHVFIDEVQDLNPAALLVFKQMVTGSLIMAGDSDQTLYMTSSPFSRAGIDIRGSGKVLKTNFRCTRQITETAVRFKNSAAGENTSGSEEAVSFREGPEPELYRAQELPVLEKLLISRVDLFINELGYDPGNICILAPRNSHIEKISELLDQSLFPCGKISSDSYSFYKRNNICISTLHSAKGLDFPVVLMFIPELHRLNKFSPYYTEQLLRNLLYTGMTRAMDHLNVFIIESSDPDPVISCLVSSFG